MALRTEVMRPVSQFAMGQSLVFFGNETLATGVITTAPLLRSLIDYGHTIERLILCGRPDTKRPLAVETVAAEHAIPVAWVSTKSELTREVSDLLSEVAVLASFGMIVPPKIIERFNFGIINVHPSLLPRYRGSTPIEQTILDGIEETGYSIMQLTAGMDEGPLYLQEPLALPARVTKQALYDLLANRVTQTLPETVTAVVSGHLPPTSQLGTPTYTQRLTKKDGLVDWNKPAPLIEREVRAYASWPKSQAVVADIDVVVLDAEPTSSEPIDVGQAQIIDKQVLIGCGQNTSLRILSLQPLGKKAMSASDFINGYMR